MTMMNQQSPSLAHCSLICWHSRNDSGTHLSSASLPTFANVTSALSQWPLLKTLQFLSHSSTAQLMTGVWMGTCHQQTQATVTHLSSTTPPVREHNISILLVELAFPSARMTLQESSLPTFAARQMHSLLFSMRCTECLGNFL